MADGFGNDEGPIRNNMIRVKCQQYFILFLCLALLSAPLYADADVLAKVHPVPITELERILCQWLTRYGFDVGRTRLEMGRIRLKAVTDRERCEILLRPHSPLATEIQARCTVGDQPGVAQLNKLWDFISGYTESLSVEMESSNQVIPAAVMSNMEAVVCITGKQEDKDIQLSGFFVDREGLIICTAHDLKGVQEITVHLYDGQGHEGHLVTIDSRRDLALLRVNFQPNTFISLVKGRNLLDLGETLYAMGCPINHGGTILSGIIDGPPRRANDLPLWQVKMQVYPGSSGSPVFDGEGNLVAIVKGRYRGTDSVGFLIPLETVMEFAEET